MTEFVKQITPDLINTNQAAQVAGVHRGTLLRAHKAGQLPATARESNGDRKTTRREYFFKRRDLKAWVEAGRPCMAAGLPALPALNGSAATVQAIPVGNSVILAEIHKLHARMGSLEELIDAMIRQWK